MNAANVAAPLVFGAIIMVAVIAFWVAPRRRLRRTDEENYHMPPRQVHRYVPPVSANKPPSNQDMDLPPYPAPAHTAHDDPVPSYEEATGQARAQGSTSYGAGNGAVGARAS